MLPLVPYLKLVITSPLTKTEAERQLSRAVAPRRLGWHLSEDRSEMFEGDVSDDGFSVRRIMRCRSSFTPLIKGYISPLTAGAQIRVTMRLQTRDIIFIMVWVGLVGTLTAFAVADALSSGSTGKGKIFFPFVLLLFLYLLATVGFGVEAGRADQLLREIFQSEKTDS